MGTEFLEKQRGSVRKYMDRRRAELRAPGLFKATPETARRQFLARAEGKPDLHVGDNLQIEAQGSGIILRRGGKVIGRNDSPHPGLKQVIRDAGGYFPGAISTVHSLSSTFEFCVVPAAKAERPRV